MGTGTPKFMFKMFSGTIKGIWARQVKRFWAVQTPPDQNLGFAPECMLVDQGIKKPVLSPEKKLTLTSR